MSRIVRDQKTAELMAAGVTIEDPATTYIDADVHDRRRHGHPSRACRSKARTTIGAGCEIHSGARIVDSRIGDRVTILNHCVITELARSPTTRRSARSRTCAPRRDVRAKREGRQFRRAEEDRARRRLEGECTSRISATRRSARRSTSAPARSPATTTASTRTQTVIEDGAFIGSDSQLIAPVTIGKGAYVGSGTTVREDVPAGALAVSAGKQRNIEGWVERRKRAQRQRQRANRYVRDYRIHRTEGSRAGSHRRAAAARVPRLRLGGRRRRPRRRGRPAPQRRQAVEPRGRHPHRPAHRRLRRRPHALGDARPADRGERAPAPRLHRQDRRRPQRHHRELSRSEAGAAARRATSSSPRPTPRSSRTWSSAR